MSPSFTILLAILTLLFLRGAILVVPEGTVVATFFLGRFRNFHPAGLHFGFFDSVIGKRVPLKIGGTCTVTSENSIDVQGYQLAVEIAGRPIIGSPGRIVGFNGVVPIVTQEGVAVVREVACEKCKHVMKIVG